MKNEPLIDAPLRRELSALYEAEGRHYHGLAHIDALLALVLEHRSSLTDPDAVEAAIWFHDAIYDSRNADNEAKSAALAKLTLGSRTSPERMERIAMMIEATATHQLPQVLEGSAKRDAALFLDMDLSILGASLEEFTAYEQAVRREYGWVPEPAWRAGRSEVLRKFLSRERIFHTEEFHSELDAKARQNIQRSLAALEGSTT